MKTRKASIFCAASLLFAACATTAPNATIVSKHHDPALETTWFINGEPVEVPIPEAFWLVRSDGSSTVVTEAEFNAANVPEQ